MKVIIVGRGLGKTRTLAKMAQEDPTLVLVTPTSSRAKRIQDEYPDLEGRILSAYQVDLGVLRGTKVKGLLVDDVLECLGYLGRMGHQHGIQAISIDCEEAEVINLNTKAKGE